MFDDNNSLNNISITPFYTNVISQNEGVAINLISNELLVNSDWNIEDLITNTFNGLENSFNYASNYLSGCGLSYEKEENISEVINNCNLKVENVESFHPLVIVMSNSHNLNPLSSYIFEDEENTKSEIISYGESDFTMVRLILHGVFRST